MTLFAKPSVSSLVCNSASRRASARACRSCRAMPQPQHGDQQHDEAEIAGLAAQRPADEATQDGGFAGGGGLASSGQATLRPAGRARRSLEFATTVDSWREAAA